jgi:hypothetical protein
VHGLAASGAVWSIFELLLCQVGDELSFTYEADIALLSSCNTPILVDCFGTALGALNIHRQNPLWDK